MHDACLQSRPFSSKLFTSHNKGDKSSACLTMYCLTAYGLYSHKWEESLQLRICLLWMTFFSESPNKTQQKAKSQLCHPPEVSLPLQPYPVIKRNRFLLAILSSLLRRRWSGSCITQHGHFLSQKFHFYLPIYTCENFISLVFYLSSFSVMIQAP